MGNLFPKMHMQNNAGLKIIPKPYRALDNRRFYRLAIGKDVDVLMLWQALKNHVLLGHLIDINEKGCGIYYLVDKRIPFDFHLQKTCELKVLGSSRMFDLPENTVVYDNELVRYSTSKISARRCGIKFDSLVKSPKSALSSILYDCGVL